MQINMQISVKKGRIVQPAWPWTTIGRTYSSFVCLTSNTPMWKPANTMQNIHSFLSWTTLAALTESVVKGSWSTIPAIPKRPVGWNVCPSTYTSSVAAVYRMWPTILVSSCWLSLRKKKTVEKIRIWHVVTGRLRWFSGRLFKSAFSPMCFATLESNHVLCGSVLRQKVIVLYSGHSGFL